MSDEPNPTPRAEEPPAAENAAAPAPEVPPDVHLGPPPEVQLGPELAIDAPWIATADHRLWGPTLWVFGALLWGYVVLGELVVNIGLEEGLAVIGLFGVLGWSWFRCTKPLLDAARTGRAAVVAASGVALFVLCLLSISLLFGSSRRSHFESVTVLLCALGVVTYAAGRRLTALPAPVRRADHSRLVSWFVWIVVGLFTVVAMASAMTHA